jgi:hypothetical protein
MACATARPTDQSSECDTLRRRPINVTYHVVVPFDRNEEGDLTAGTAEKAPSALAAERGARSLAHIHAGAVAFSRTGNPTIGEFQDKVILASSSCKVPK